MRVVKRPDFNKKHSEAVLFDGKRRYIVNIEIDDHSRGYSFIDYTNSKICLRENSPDPEAEFFHEIHHLYLPLLEPLWTLTLPTLVDKSPLARIYNSNEGEEIIKTLERAIKPRRDYKSKLLVELIREFIRPIVSLGRFDNVLEDKKIHDHLIKRHRMDEKRLDIIERDTKLVQYAAILFYERLSLLYGSISLLEKFRDALRSLVRESNYGFVLYPFFDVIVCKSNNWALGEYYEFCIRSLKDAKKSLSNLRGIYKLATLKRINLELFRVTLMREALEEPQLCHFCACILSSGGLPKNEIEELLGVKITKGFRDPLTVAKNGEFVTRYRRYKVNRTK